MGSISTKRRTRIFLLDELIVDLILDAPELTIQQVKERVAILKGQVGDDRQVIRSYGVTENCWTNVIKPAMELADRN